MIKSTLLLSLVSLTLVYSQLFTEFKCNGTIVNCFASPCAVDSSSRHECAKKLNATCVDNYCNGCNAIYYLNGEVVCQKEVKSCPKCQNQKKCSNGYKIDLQTGCNTCDCKCNPQYCPYIYCPNGFEEDNNGCPTCQCKKVCPPVCLIYCYNGNVLDKNGCPTCKCRDCPLKKCAANCSYGYVLDDKGCQTCQCKPRCPPVCDIYCTNGNVLDENGCPTCKCKPKCNLLYCLRYCPYGYKFDQNGCPTCDCNCPLLRCLTPNCPEGQTNLDVDGCKTCSCRHICPSVYCKKYCQYGYEYNANGCQICKCKPRPICPAIACLYKKCPYGRKYINGCPTCQCKSCPDVICSRYCLYGFKIDPTTGCRTCDCNEKPVCTKDDPYFKAICPLKCDNYAKDNNGCPTCSCEPIIPQCTCHKPTYYVPKKCLDGSHSSLTSICVRLPNGKCYFYERKCPLCFTIRISIKLTETEIITLKDVVFRRSHTVPEKDVTLKLTSITSGLFTYVTCISYDVFPTDLTPQQYVMKQLQTFEPLQTHYDYIVSEEKEAENASNVLAILYFLMFILLMI